MSENLFQSTLPTRGATARYLPTAAARYFNPRSPHGERQALVTGAACVMDFNPRSPHGERQAPFATSISCR